jgi:hypothetical protein
MINFIKEFIEYLIAKYKTTHFSIDTIRFELISRYNKKTLMYPNIGKMWLKQFFDMIQMLGYGNYDVAGMEFNVNKNKDDVAIWLAKYGVKCE